jgi:hypothetical protein
MIEIHGDYRKAFTQKGQVTGHEVVNIDFTRVPSPFSPWPVRRVGTVTKSVIEKHLKACALMVECGKKDYEVKECVQAGNHDCRCPAWFAYLRAELKKASEAA